MNMQTILFVINNMNIGGIQKSLLELLKCISDKYNISLYCIDDNSIMLKEVPQNVHILPIKKIAKVSEYSLSDCKKLGKIYYFIRLILSSLTKIFGKKLPVVLFCGLNGKLSGKYDVAISFVQPVNDKEFYNLSNEIVLKSVNTKKRVSFVHCDFISYGGNTKYNRNLYKKFDVVATVSNGVKGQFLKVNKDLEDKTQTVLNCCNFDYVRKMADIDPVKYNQKSFVTVARLAREKGLVRCISVFKKLKEEGYSFEWHIVGGGSLKNELKGLINANKLEENIFLEGEQVNPYRYIKNADYFLLPSFHEAAPMVYNESACLGVPILTTSTLSAVELVEERKCGIVCENTEDGLYKILKEAMEEQFIVDNNVIFDNSKAIMQFDDLCKGV